MWVYRTRREAQTGEPDALKGARPVRGGEDGKVPSGKVLDGNSSASYSTMLGGLHEEGSWVRHVPCAREFRLFEVLCCQDCVHYLLT